jgi:hypothetical protein
MNLLTKEDWGFSVHALDKISEQEEAKLRFTYTKFMSDYGEQFLKLKLSTILKSMVIFNKYAH